MKKIGISLFLVFYMLMAIGLRLSVHFCHGHIDSISLWSAQQDDMCCTKKRPMKKGRCCSDQTIEAKIKADQNSSQSGTHVPPVYKSQIAGCMQPFSCNPSLLSSGHRIVPISPSSGRLWAADLHQRS